MYHVMPKLSNEFDWFSCEGSLLKVKVVNMTDMSFNR